jgi:pSer/pThr/pTyr-binding forkhead associated (FHA) protein
MTQKGGNDSPTATVVDPRLAPHRLKTSLIPPDTGVFIRIDESPNIAETGRVFDLSEGGMYLIGRDGADIVLNDPQVSRKHAEIGLYGPEAYVLRDLASSNGTRLNGRRITDRAKLSHGDVFEIGGFVLSFSAVENAVKPS